MKGSESLRGILGGKTGSPAHCPPDSVPQTPAKDCVLCTPAFPLMDRDPDEKKYCSIGLEYAIIATHSGKRLLCAFTRAIVGLNLSLKGLETKNMER